MPVRLAIVALACLASLDCAARRAPRAGNVKIIDRVEFVVDLLTMVEGKDGKMYQACEVVGYRTHYTDGTMSFERKKK